MSWLFASALVGQRPIRQHCKAQTRRPLDRTNTRYYTTQGTHCYFKPSHQIKFCPVQKKNLCKGPLVVSWISYLHFLIVSLYSAISLQINFCLRVDWLYGNINLLCCSTNSSCKQWKQKLPKTFEWLHRLSFNWQTTLWGHPTRKKDNLHRGWQKSIADLTGNLACASNPVSKLELTKDKNKT